jgi:hypothetical protein
MLAKFAPVLQLVHRSLTVNQPMAHDEKIICEADGKSKLTVIAPYKNGYAVAISQAINANGATGAFLGCYLLSPSWPNGNKPMLLGEAFKEYERLSRQQIESTPDHSGGT